MEGIQIVIGVIIALVISGLAVAYSMGAFSSSTTGQVNLLAPTAVTIKEGANYYLKVDFKVQSTYKTPIKITRITIDGSALPANSQVNGANSDGTGLDIQVDPGSQKLITLKLPYGNSATEAGQHVIEVTYEDMNGNTLGTATVEYVVS